MTYFLFYAVVIFALGASSLFVWGIWQVLHIKSVTRKKYEAAKKTFAIKRSEQNPLLNPGKYEFEKEAVMNPATIHDGENTHLFYRAIGSDGVSRIGYARSEDGEHFADRLPYPVFALEGPDPHMAALRRAYAEENYPALVASGGTWGGTEDPRAVLIDGRVYLSFSAFHNWDSVRIGMTSIDVEDLKQKKWKWSPTTFLSAANQVHKNWVLFPEKVNGQFAMLHSISPSVDIAYRDNILKVGSSEPLIQSDNRPRVDVVDNKVGHWHSRMRGAGTPPIKTPFGWLLFYHAMHGHEMGRYKLGAMLLDSKDPSKVIARAPAPVLEPDAHYENSGIKPGVVYASGSTVKDDKLTLYYGAADNYICSASTSLSKFVDSLRKHPEGKTLTANTIPQFA